MTRYDRGSPILCRSDYVVRKAHTIFVASSSGAQKRALELGHLTYSQTLLGARRSIFIYREVSQYVR